MDELVKKLTLEEKAPLVSGHNFMETNGIARLDIPVLVTSDGPHGLRVQDKQKDNGIAESLPATCFPTASATSSSWNIDLLNKMGIAMAKEAKHYGINVILGPGTNIKKNPLCGRNFEYFSEDPFLAGLLASSLIKGIQSEGVAACPKHFALNNAENFRFFGNSIADIRTINEIYLKPFEILVKESSPWALMCSYNQINSTYASENSYLLAKTLREKWGFDGLVMTDWGAMADRVASIKAGLDLEMPGDTKICRKWIIDGVKNGSLEEKYLDKAVDNLLKLIERTRIDEKPEVDWENHYQLSLEIALDSAVLLKNEGALPLKIDKPICIIGELFERMRYQGSGSSMINPYKLVTPKDSFDVHKVNYVYAKGYRESQNEVDQSLIDEAIKVSSSFEEVILFIGLTDYFESEGFDRENLSLPKNQLALINALINEGKKVIIVSFGGSPFEMPFVEKASSILHMYLPGEAGGEACFKLVYGEVSPSGKLAETWPKSINHIPFIESYSKTKLELYKESIYVGYRYYQSFDKGVLFPFGYGLSYSKFEYRDLKIIEEGNSIKISYYLKNIGELPAKEISQIYISSPAKQIYRPKYELKGFNKTYLNPGEEKCIIITLNKADLSYYSPSKHQFILENGVHRILIGKSVNEIVLESFINIEEESIDEFYPKEYENFDPKNITDEIFEKLINDKIPSLPPVTPITLDSRFSDLQYTRLGKLIYKAVLSYPNKQYKRALKMKEGIEKDNKIKGAIFLKRVMESNCLRSMSMAGGKLFPYNIALGIEELANGHIFKALRQFCRRIKVPRLPKAHK